MQNFIGLWPFAIVERTSAFSNILILGDNLNYLGIVSPNVVSKLSSSCSRLLTLMVLGEPLGSCMTVAEVNQPCSWAGQTADSALQSSPQGLSSM